MYTPKLLEKGGRKQTGNQRSALSGAEWVSSLCKNLKRLLAGTWFDRLETCLCTSEEKMYFFECYNMSNKYAYLKTNTKIDTKATNVHW